ncbi:uncharacterized protein MYCGRDRAFT_106556 [Zymoseptoria tritici IPO323]|uniref:Uncharacterized protein n=1 Tax=Zymoseptoria tritici (strain CBS 115943 / IPO323) TaxID=336722 RepID=F9XQD8_ZYMTI|nr:uncharacterized protein MYCGRDRAFT_106556 [Zymoseptoria tritici IPO323]EGP82624.1 hypothetical protein MYCGRDRAFT_106556 [Zymoseptoria tritici IPO323]
MPFALQHPDAKAVSDHQTCTLNIPISISVQGPAKFPTYEIRLGDILGGLLKLDNLSSGILQEDATIVSVHASSTMPLQVVSCDHATKSPHRESLTQCSLEFPSA